MDSIEFKLYNSCIKYETKTFSAKHLQHKMQKFGKKISLKTLRIWLKEDMNVFQLGEDLYITKAGCFTGREFGIKPSKYEIENNILIVGHRCVPFIDGDVLPFEIDFSYNSERINCITKNILTSELIQHHKVFGEENFLQYVMYDPVNEGKDFSFNGFELPSFLDFTVLDMKDFYQKNDFEFGDWIRASVTSYADSIISFEADCYHTLNPFEKSVYDEKKEEWNKKFEELLIENLRKFGPRSCIEEQIMLHYVNSMLDLSVSYAGSVEDFLQHTEKIGFCEFGVESRLWILNEEISDSKNWVGKSMEGEPEGTSEYMGLQISQEILDAFVLDALFKKEEDSSNIIERMFFDEYHNSVEIEISKILLKNRFEYLKKFYNWFADYEVAPLRERALKIFKNTHFIFKNIEESQTRVEDYNQQDLITFMQLYSHIKKMIESLVLIDELDQSSINAAYSSLDGMEFTLEEIRGSIEAVLKRGPWNSSFNI